MEETYQKMVWMGISLLVLGVIIGMISGSVYLSYKYNDKQIENQSMASEMAEQRNNMFYDNTHVYQQDIVEYIFRFKGERAVSVHLTTQDVTHTWSQFTEASEYKISAVSTLLPKDLIYDSVLVYGPNGREVVGVDFVECIKNTNPGADCSFD